MNKTPNFQPYEDKVILRTIKKNVSEGGIFIPDVEGEKPFTGEVIAVGNGKVLPDGTVQPMKTSIGDIVIYPQFAALKLDYDGEEYIVIRESDLFSKLPKKEN